MSEDVKGSAQSQPGKLDASHRSSDETPAPAGPEVPEDDGAGYEPGSVLWHCSEEDSGPDVGIQIGLGLGLSLYCGELSKATLEAHGIDLAVYPDGWWLVLYGPEDQWIIGAVPENYRAQDAVEHIGWAVGEAIKSPRKAPTAGPASANLHRLDELESTIEALRAERDEALDGERSSDGALFLVKAECARKVSSAEAARDQALAQVAAFKGAMGEILAIPQTTDDDLIDRRAVFHIICGVIPPDNRGK